MHEYSLVQSLLGMIDEEMKAYPDCQLQSFSVQVGAMSCVEAEFLKGAFEMLKDGSPAENARMRINYVPLRCRCENCLTEFDVKQFNFLCPACDDAKIVILQGDDTILESLELEEVEACP